MILLDPTARLIIGHRGASGEYPENTMLAFRRAVEQQADALEFDVRLSADRVPVVIHDETVDRTTNGLGAVSEQRFEALRELDAGRGEQIPALAEVLEVFPTTPLILEVKTVPAGPAVARMLEHHGAASRVLLGAFEHAALRAFPPGRFYRSASRRETAFFWLRSRLSMRAPSRAAYRAFTVPEWHGRLHVVDERFAAAAKQCRRPVHVWTVDDSGDAHRLWAGGIAGIITNHPGRMRAA